MNEIKVQQDIIKEYNKPQSTVRVGGLVDGRIAVTLDGHAAYILYEPSFLLDKSKIKEVDFQKIFGEVSEAKEIYPTGVTVETTQGKKTVKLKEFKNDETTVYFDEKLFKYFDGYTTFKYYKTKLFVFENGMMMGMVLECKRNH